MKRYADQLEAIRWGTVAGTRSWGTRYKIAEINRGTQERIRKTTKDHQSAVTRWLYTHWPLDVWTVSYEASDDETVGYELFVTFHATRKRPQDVGRLKAKLRRERRAQRAT